MKYIKGFTLAEVLITLAVLGVIFAATLPVLVSISPNKEHLMFRKAYQLTSSIVTELVNDTNLYPEPEDEDSYFLRNTIDVTEKGNEYGGNTKFCELFLSRINTLSSIGCVADNANDAVLQFQFVTPDGIAWYLPITNFAEAGVENYQIIIDANGQDKTPNCFYHEDNCPKPDRFTINLQFDGRLNVDGLEKESEYLLESNIAGN